MLSIYKEHWQRRRRIRSGARKYRILAPECLNVPSLGGETRIQRGDCFCFRTHKEAQRFGHRVLSPLDANMNSAAYSEPRVIETRLRKGRKEFPWLP